MIIRLDLTPVDYARLLALLDDAQVLLVANVNMARKSRAPAGLTDYLANVLGTVANVREQLQAGKPA